MLIFIGVMLVLGVYLLLAVLIMSLILYKRLDHFEMIVMCVLAAIAGAMIIGSLSYPYG